MARGLGLVLVSVLAGVLSAAAAPAAPGEAVTPAQAEPVACSVTAGLAGGMLRIRAVATALSATRGRYALAIAKDTAAGTARTLQSGEVTLEAGQTHELATVAMEAAAAGHVAAQLALETPAGRVTCSYP